MVFSGGLEEGFGDGNDVRSIYVPAELSAALALTCVTVCAELLGHVLLDQGR